MPNTFAYGPSSSGKTAAIKSAVRSLMCLNRTPSTSSRCGHCDSCRQFQVNHQNSGLFAELCGTGIGIPIHWFPINCGEITQQALRELILEVSQCEGRVIVYLDEAHRLASNQRDELLLIPLREIPATWIASSAHPERLDEMFRNRFTSKLSTELPTRGELVEFLKARCQEWKIEYDAEETLQRISVRCRSSVGHALGLLAEAAGISDRRITMEMAESHSFFLEDDSENFAAS